ncbi:MAG: cytochrome c oxidase subunit II [Planctomycetota bacterium]
MKLHALLLAGAMFLGATHDARAFQDDAAAPESTTTEATTTDSIASDEAAPGDESAEAAPAPAATDFLTDEEVDALIATYNAENGESRSFTEQERGWIARKENNVGPEDVDDVHKGYFYIRTGDDNVLKYFRNGEEHTVESGGDLVTPPAGPHIGPFTPEVDNGSFWTAVVASESAREVDAMFNFIMWTCYIFSVLIGVLMVVFVIKYRRRPGVKADQSITHNTPLEIFWSVVPAVLVAIMFWGGYTTFLDMRTPPPDAMTIDVVAKKWGWDFTYDTGASSQQEFHVPENTPIRMDMTSSDVIHCFHLPSFRVKSDILPDRYTTVWFDSGAPGTYTLYCTEYCGTGHSNMYAKLVVEPQEDYEKWLEAAGAWHLDADGNPLPPVVVGEKAYTKLGCKTCHSINGTKVIGPSFASLWGAERRFDPNCPDSETVPAADKNYIRRSILKPHDQIVLGYPDQMANYSHLKDHEIKGLIAYIKSLADVPKQYSEVWE